MSRKQFIISHGATCDNWTWSWSFINTVKKIIIFGAWDFLTENDKTLILSDEWKVNKKGRKSKGYIQSLKHIRLIKDEGYSLMTFAIYKTPKSDIDSPKIAHFTEELVEKTLLSKGSKHYAVSVLSKTFLTEEITIPEEELFEGSFKKVNVNSYERNAEARKRCIEYHGYNCSVCKFNFNDMYGELGKNFIHVHHITPLSTIKENYKVNPIEDLIPVCANCHSMIHRKRKALSIQELKSIISLQSNCC